MVRIIRIVYTYGDGHKEVQKPAYTAFASKEQMETFRAILIKNFNCKSVSLAYEEYR